MMTDDGQLDIPLRHESTSHGYEVLMTSFSHPQLLRASGRSSSSLSYLPAVNSFIHSFIPDISIAPLQVQYYSEALSRLE